MPDPAAQFCDAVVRIVPEDATVAVVSRGDPRLLKLHGREGWHFPQRADRVYAGYYPADSAAAIAHLESVRERGAKYIAFPAAAMWWLDHYVNLTRHLETNYRLVLRDEPIGAIYGLTEGPVKRKASAVGAAAEKPSSEPAGSPQELAAKIETALLDDLRSLFDPTYYAEQAGRKFPSDDAALAHYLNSGHARGLQPHVLFDARWYADQYAEAAAPGANPLLHFLEHSEEGCQDPNPYFDTEFYYRQRPHLRGRSNALVHYLAPPAGETSANPNPLFVDGYYRQAYPDVDRSSFSPLEHYLLLGTSNGRFVSHIQKNMLDRLRQSSIKALTRGNWKRGTVLVFSRGGKDHGEVALEQFAAVLAEEHRLDSIVVVLRRSPASDMGPHAKVLVLEDYELAGDVFRPSALRTLVRTLLRLKPLLALSQVSDVLWTLHAGGIPAYEMGNRPEPPRAHLDRAVRDFGLDPTIAAPERASQPLTPTKVLMLCSDWSVSGVNAALEAVGQELIRKGWDVEIIFTRDESFVVESAHGEEHLPPLPYHFLERSRSGVDGLWESLIAAIQRNGPCIVLMAYDQVANAVGPALTDDIGIVSWMQADDRDYYEQAYRLGRYCNAIVCVSSYIRETAIALNPALAEHTHVIHNTSVAAKDVAQRRPRRPEHMQLVYAGRLVQYQKRVLDYIELASALDRTGVSYEISLIGEFVSKEGIQPVFEQRGRAHLDDGRIRLLGRLPRKRILEQLTRTTFFPLLSDFEGLPLSLVEAMAAGCVPIVAEMPSGIPELVTSGHDGVIMSGRDYDAWAALLVELWEDGARLTAMSRNARKTVREAFTIEKIGGEFDRLLCRIADDITSGRYRRPDPLHWGRGRSPSGDVLPSPNLFYPPTFAQYPGLT